MAGKNSGGAQPLGQLICGLRQAQGYSHGQLAGLLCRLSGKPVMCETVQYWESGTHAPSPDEIGYLAIALEVPIFMLEAALLGTPDVATDEVIDHSAKGKPAMNPAMNVDDMHIGRRVRQIRYWRDLSQPVVAGLAGISPSYLSLIELGHRPVTKRSLLEALANALRVSPADLTDKPWERANDRTGAQMHAGLVAVTDALDRYELGDDPGEPAREWPEVESDVKRLMDMAYAHANFADAAKLAPPLLAELHTTYVRNPEQRSNVLQSLIMCYRAAGSVTERFGGSSNGFTLMAAKAAQHCANELESPQWRGITTWMRAHSGSPNRAHQYQRVVRAADELLPALDDAEVVQAYGMLHLSAALSAAAQSDRDTATTHLNEASEVAGRIDTEVGTFARAWFGRTNVGIWRVSIGVELGDGISVAEVARSIRVEAIPSTSRQAEFYADFGRSLLAEKSTRDNGLALLLRAENLAPQRIRNDVFVREAVGDALRTARRDAGSVELRGLAYRLGLRYSGGEC
jgi:transcriptional regulator with XRE-family HTH domain